MRKFTLRISFLVFLIGAFSVASIAQNSTTNSLCLGGTYKQNFDDIGNSATAALPAGFKVDINSGVNQVGSYAAASTTTDHRGGADLNSANNSGIYNFGAGTTTVGNGDRAIGGVTGSNADKSVNIYLDLQNTCAQTISDYNLTYSIEKYRNGSNPDGYSVKLYYSLTGLANSWTSIPTTNSDYAFDNNESGFNPAPDASQTRYISANVTGLSVASGTHIYFAWNISTTSTTPGSAPNKSMALAIDDIKIKTTAAGFIQTPMYFRSIASGIWNSSFTWQSSPDNVTWGAANRAPNYLDYTITLQSPFTVTVNSAVEADQTIINPGATLDIVNGGTLSIKDGPGFDITVNGTLSNTSGSLIIRSENTDQSDVGTASVGPVTGTITGNATVERYISAKLPSTSATTAGRSAWRLLTAPLKTGTVSNNIYANWQNSGTYVPGVGTTVSGPQYPGNGLDYYSAAPSMKSWDGTAFVPVSNTTTTPLFSNTGNIGYFTFVRGDRSVTTLGAANQTVLSATGKLITGNVSVPTSTTNDAFTLVGNPYASPVDLLTFSIDNSGSNTKTNYYYWDPYQYGMWGVGGYVTVSVDQNNNVIITPESNGNVANETRFLQSGQAMFVQTRSVGNGGAASVTFNEDEKSYNTVNNVFRTESTQVDMLRLNLKVISSGSSILLDGVVAAFNNNFNAKVDDYDAVKLYNIGENISLMRNGSALSVERRPTITSEDVLYIGLSNLKANETYQFEIKPSVNTNGLTAYLVDNYLKTTTGINLSKATTVNFTSNADAASTGANRFYIAFAKPAAIVSGNPAISVFPNPVTNGIINLQMSNMPAGVYTARIFNGMGQVIATKQINHAAGSSTETIVLGKGTVKGIYQLEVVKPDNSKFSSKVMAN